MNHVGWFGHDNLGDDEMLRLLEEHLPGVKTFGGGTLIAPTSEFFDELEKMFPEETVGISLGVSENWNGERVDVLRRLKRIYVRDVFSYERLKEHGLDPIMSVDLWFAHEPVGYRGGRVRSLNAMDVIDLTHKSHYLTELTKRYVEAFPSYERFNMSPSHPLGGETYIPKTGAELITYLSNVETAVVTRLHALVAATIAGVPDIRPIFYDAKCRHFLERMGTIGVQGAHDLMLKHLEEIRNL